MYITKNHPPVREQANVVAAVEALEDDLEVSLVHQAYSIRVLFKLVHFLKVSRCLTLCTREGV